MIGTVYSVLNFMNYDIKLQWRELFWKVKICVDCFASSHSNVNLVTLYYFKTFSEDY